MRRRIRFPIGWCWWVPVRDRFRFSALDETFDNSIGSPGDASYVWINPVVAE